MQINRRLFFRMKNSRFDMEKKNYAKSKKNKSLDRILTFENQTAKNWTHIED